MKKKVFTLPPTKLYIQLTTELDRFVATELREPPSQAAFRIVRSVQGVRLESFIESKNDLPSEIRDFPADHPRFQRCVRDAHKVYLATKGIHLD